MRRWIAPSIVLLSVVITAIVFPRLPETIPTHWNTNGDIDGWSGRWFVWMLPVALAMLWAMIRWLPAIDPRGANYARFAGAFEGIFILLMLFIFGLHVVILSAALGKDVSVERLAPAGLGLLLIGLGILLPRARPNWFVGIRTPWTLSNDRVWERTHRFGGQLFIVAGVLIVIAAFISSRLAFPVMIWSCALAAVILLVYSFVAWRQEAGHTSS
jgi:uncharacterized membrane protein